VTPWRPPFGGPLPADPSLDAFRNSVARLMYGSRTVGYIAFRVDRSSRLVRGHLWWREWAMPKEVVEWMQTMVDGSDSYDVTQMSDGIIEDPAANGWLRAVRSGEADDFREARAEIRYRVVWLSGAERTAAWERYGYGGAD